MKRTEPKKGRIWAAVAVALGVTLAGCGSNPLNHPAAGSQSTPATASGESGAAAGTSGPAGGTALADAVAYSECIRSHGVPNFPDPVQTPSGGYGYRTAGIDPSSASFQGAIQACKNLPSPWNSTSQQLTAAQQQAWLNWAQCIRTHGVPDFPDPTFSGRQVHDSGVGSNSPQLQQAEGTCKPHMPSVGGLGG